MKTIFKLLVLLVLAVYFVLAITIFNTPKEGALCNKVELIIEDSLQTGFVTESDVRGLLTKAKLFPEGKKLDCINLAQIEDTLTRSPYIGKALCYRTATDNIHIRVTPLQPVMHIISNSGDNYYIEGSGKIMPRHGFRANVVVATGHISKKFARQNLAPLGRFIQSDPFWNAQIQQINVLENQEVELIPRIGDHVILLGETKQFREKLNRMRLFYDEGLKKVGWNKYAVINLKYADQIICTRHK